jgi:cytochrome c oxidase assembly factor CtaG
VPTALLHTHNLLRWVILVLAVLTLVKAVQGLSGTKPYAETRRIGVMFMASLHVQLVLGLLLFLTSPLVEAAMADMRTAMGERDVRFFIAEHPTLMVAATIVATIGGIVAKNAADDRAKHRKLLVFTLITVALLLAGIPWQRPMFPGM